MSSEGASRTNSDDIKTGANVPTLPVAPVNCRNAKGSFASAVGLCHARRLSTPPPHSGGARKYAALQYEKLSRILGARPLNCKGRLSHVLSSCRDNRRVGRNTRHAGGAMRAVFGAIAKLVRNFPVAPIEYDLLTTRRWGLVTGILCRGGSYGRTQHTRTRLEF